MSTRTLLILALLFGSALVGMVPSTTAQIYNARVPARQVDNLLRRIETRTDSFKRNMETALDRSNINNTNREDRIADFIRDFETATDVLRRRFDSRQSVGAELNEVLSRATRIDRFMNRNRLSAAVESEWLSLRSDLNTLASYYNLSWDWNRNMTWNDYPIGDRDMGRPVYTVSDARVRSLLTRIESRTDTFRRQMQRSLDRGIWDDTQREDSIAKYVTEFENATDRLKQRFDARQSTAADASEVLTRAWYIDRFVARNRVSAGVRSQWSLLRSDLDTLASYYSVAWNWDRTLPPYPGDRVPAGGFDARITGTYRLNRSQSDDVSQVIDRSINYYPSAQQARIRRNLERRLNSPDMLAIEKVNNTVTLASSLSPQVSFDVNGMTRTETNNRGRTIRTTATSNLNGLTIAYEGDRTNDYYVTFSPVGTNQLRVTRRIYLENRNDQVTVTSVYDKIDDIARWSAVTTDSTWAGNTGDAARDFYVPNGTRMTAVLRDMVSTRASQVGDRFTMEVTSPSQYRGAIIEGRVTQAQSSGRVTGRANLSLDFDTIRLPNGSTYRFAGIIDSVRAANGDSVSVTNEGTVRDSNQTTRTATRAGIGAVLGALIGAIAGGGEGAAIGAAIGAGAGAGTILIQGRDTLELGAGSEFNITATGPNSVGFNR